MFMGFILHIYIIFGTNLLTGGPAHIVVFCLFQYIEGKGYQTESKRNETFSNVILGKIMIQETWSASQGSIEDATRQGGAPTPLGVPSTLVGPLWLPEPTSFAYIVPHTLKTSTEKIDREFRRRKPL